MERRQRPHREQHLRQPVLQRCDSHDLCDQPDAVERSCVQLQRQPNRHPAEQPDRASERISPRTASSPGPNNLDRIPEIHLAGYNNTDYTNASWPWNNKADDYQIRDDISWTKGAHQIKMGGSWAIYKKVQDLFGNTQGSFTFNNNFTGNDFADFLLGTASGYNELAVQDSGNGTMFPGLHMRRTTGA